MSERDRPLSPPKTLGDLEQQLRVTQERQYLLELQSELLHMWSSLRQTCNYHLTIRGLLQHTLKNLTGFTKAEEGSIFWLNDEGTVEESILARGAVISEEREKVIGKVLDEGLAGWVCKNRQMGMITDTMFDHRWTKLPNQPYKVRSVICVPLMYKKHVLGVITLTHSLPSHFDVELADLLNEGMHHIAVLLYQVRTTNPKHQKGGLIRPTTGGKINKVQGDGVQMINPGQRLNHMGLFIVTAWGRFIYCNQKLAHIFGYELEELLIDGSLLSLVVPGDREVVFDSINHCLRGDVEEIWSNFQAKHKTQALLNVEIYGQRTRLGSKFVLIGMLRSENLGTVMSVA